MTARELPPESVQAELRRLEVTECALIRECSHANRCSVNQYILDPLIDLCVSRHRGPTRSARAKGGY